MKNKRAIFAICVGMLSMVISACSMLPSNFTPRRRSSSEENNEISSKYEEDEKSSINRSSSNRTSSSSKQSSSSRIPSSSSSSSSSISQHEHTFNEDVWEKDATYHWHPSTCGHPDAKGSREKHIFSDPYDVREATCIDSERYSQICVVCGYDETHYGSLGDHSFVLDESMPIVQPTKEAPGQATYRCQYCGTTEVRAINYGETLETALTAEEAKQIAQTLEVKSYTQSYYYIKGNITEITSNRIANYRTITLWIGNETDSRVFQFYNIRVPELFTESQFVVGSEIVGYGPIHRYSETTYELYNNSQVFSIKAQTIEITNISFESSELYMVEGTSYKLNPILEPTYANEMFSWRSNNALVAMVDGTMKIIRAYRPGTCVITAYVDRNKNGEIDEGDPQAAINVHVETAALAFDSTDILGYDGTSDIPFGNYGRAFPSSYGDISLGGESVSAERGYNGDIRFKANGIGKLSFSNFSYPIAAVYLEESSLGKYGFDLYGGHNVDTISSEPVTPETFGHVYRFDKGEAIYAFNIVCNNNVNGLLSFIKIVLYEEENDSIPNGNYSGNAMLHDGSLLFVNVALNTPYVSLRLGTESFLTTYTYNSNNHTLSAWINNTYGNFSAVFDYRYNRLCHGHISGQISSSIANNNDINLDGPALLWDCNEAEDELRAIFKRRYRSSDMWIIDNNNEDRINCYSDGDIKALSLRPYAGGAVALNLASDLDAPLTCRGFGFWVYNPSETEITLRMWMYKGTGHTNTYEIANAKALPQQWTYCLALFQQSYTYNFQIADFTNSGVRLVFDNICLF